MLHIKFGIKIGTVLKNILPAGITALVMSILGVVLKNLHDGLFWQLISVFISVLVYSVLLYLLPFSKKDILSLVNIVNLNPKIRKGNESR